MCREKPCHHRAPPQLVRIESDDPDVYSEGNPKGDSNDNWAEDREEMDDHDDDYDDEPLPCPRPPTPPQDGHRCLDLLCLSRHHRHNLVSSTIAEWRRRRDLTLRHRHYRTVAGGTSGATFIAGGRH
ncbi:hypothetical protein ACP4OV_010405 [Aristida adscensionis]